MKTFKGQSVIILAALFAGIVLLSGCIPRDERAKSPFPRHADELMQTITEKLKDGTLKDSLPPELVSSISERIRTGTIRDFFPPASVMIPAMLIPIVGILALLAFLILFIRLYHIRIMSMIEKGNYERKPLNVRWELFFLFFGILLTFIGPAVSIYMISLFAFQGWTITSGIIPLFIGIALLVFYRMYARVKKNNTI